MTWLPRISGRQCISALEKMGFARIRQAGSHIILRRSSPFAQVVVPDHRELDTGTLRAILRHADVNIEEFLRLV